MGWPVLFEIQMNVVYRIANSPSFFMYLTGIGECLYQTNIQKFAALFYLCPHACYLIPLISGNLTLNTNISRTVAYENASTFSKNPLVLIFEILKSCSDWQKTTAFN